MDENMQIVLLERRIHVSLILKIILYIYIFYLFYLFYKKN